MSLTREEGAKTYLGDVALFDYEVSDVEWAIAAEHEFLKRATRSSVDKTLFSHEDFEGL